MNKQSIRKAVSRWADRTGGVSPTAQARLVEELARNLEAAPAAVIPCTCGQDDGLHEWDCAIRKHAEGRSPTAPVLSADGISAIEECIMICGFTASQRDLATRASAELEYLHALVDKGRQDSDALASHLSRTYRGRHE